MNAYPIYKINQVWHVGSMNPQLKKKNSHEGSGLSVSTCPNEWVKIANCSGDTIKLEKKEGLFLDFYEMDKEQIQKMIDWGVRNEYITLKTLYEYKIWSDEFDCEMVGLTTTYKDAIDQCGDKENISIKKYQPVSTEKLKRRTMGAAEPMLVLDLLSTIYAEDVLNLDGVWFHDELNVEKLSAPRGVIVPKQLISWMKNNQNQ